MTLFMSISSETRKGRGITELDRVGIWKVLLQGIDQVEGNIIVIPTVLFDDLPTLTDDDKVPHI